MYNAKKAFDKSFKNKNPDYHDIPLDLKHSVTL